VQAGDIGLCHGTGLLDRTIEFGEKLRGAGSYSQWSHAFVVVSNGGDTIEARSRGVVRSTVGSHGKALRIFDCPAGVDRDAVVAKAVESLGIEYGYLQDVLLGIDCLTHWKLHVRGDALFCSELAAICLQAGGWKCPMPPSLVMPSTLGRLLS
jgi:hypothetical protein